MVQQSNTTLGYIKTKIRRLTATASTSALSDADLETYINNFYNNDFPYAIKLDQMRSVYTFFTEPNIDRYPLDVNYNQGMRAPIYVDGVQGFFYKDRQEFYNVFPRWPTLFQQPATTVTGTITTVTQSSNPPGALVSSPNHNLVIGSVITINGVVGMTQLNGNTYTVITVVDANTFNIGVDSSAFTPYVSGGTWVGTSSVFSFTISPTPFLSNEVLIGGVDQNGSPITIQDDGNGNLQLQNPNPVVSIPPEGAVYVPTDPPSFPASFNGLPIPGMKNINTLNPGLNSVQTIGVVNYVTGQIAFTLPNGQSLGNGEVFRIWVSQYTTGRPYAVLFWNNEISIRPVPKYAHKIEIESYLSPCQFMQNSDNPILNQWAYYIAYGTSMEILRDRQDIEGVENLREGFMRQESLVLERQGVEEIGQRNSTIFAGSTPQQGYNQGWTQGGWM